LWNFIPLITLIISILAMIKSVITKNCCLLKGWDFETICVFNVEITIIFLVPHLFIFTLLSLIFCVTIYLLIIKPIGLTIKFLIKFVKQYNKICSKNKL